VIEAGFDRISEFSEFPHGDYPEMPHFNPTSFTLYFIGKNSSSKNLCPL
jgi:hypothetical protein